MGGGVDPMSDDWKPFELHTAQHGETTCIAILGEFELLGLDQLAQELQAAEASSGRAVLDLRGLKFIDSTGSTDETLGRDLVA
jgi:anti-anti-sigma regulatory factor